MTKEDWAWELPALWQKAPIKSLKNWAKKMGVAPRSWRSREDLVKAVSLFLGLDSQDRISKILNSRVSPDARFAELWSWGHLDNDRVFSLPYSTQELRRLASLAEVSLVDCGDRRKVVEALNQVGGRKFAKKLAVSISLKPLEI